MFEFTPLVIAAIPVTLGLVQVIKLAFCLPDRFAPLTSIIVGILLVWLTNPGLTNAVIPGIIIGLSASGLWSGSKATVQG